MLSAFPKADGSFSLSLQLPRDGDINFDTLQTESALMAFFEAYFPDVVPLADGKLTDFLDRPDGSMLTVRAFPWAYQDKVLLIGDAAHGILPFLGQGANSGFEDLKWSCWRVWMNTPEIGARSSLPLNKRANRMPILLPICLTKITWFAGQSRRRQLFIAQTNRT